MFVRLIDVGIDMYYAVRSTLNFMLNIIVSHYQSVVPRLACYCLTMQFPFSSQLV
jgi:hypothetical protein